MSVDNGYLSPGMPSYAQLAYTQPVGNQVAAEQADNAAAKTRQQQQSVQLTDYTWIEQTTGEGVGAFTVLFDVAFTAEPVVAHGMTLPDFAAQIRSDVTSATQAATDAQAAANAYQWSFPGNITIGVFENVQGDTYKYASTGISNATNDGKKISLVVTLQAGGISTAVLTNAGGTVTVTGRANDTWQLLADGVPLSATSGPSTGTTHAIAILTQDVIDARKKAATAVTAVGDTLALGGDATNYPLCNVFVKRWIMNNQNNYIGAECIVVVKTFKAETPAPEPSLPPIGSEPTAS